jgi:hypothetical protein
LVNRGPSYSEKDGMGGRAAHFVVRLDLQQSTFWLSQQVGYE